MAVGFSNTNKPLNPRGQDASPKGYNRASLFSGKALDFDGVNDRLDGGSIDALGTGDFSYSVYFNPDGFSSYHGLFAIGTIYNFGLLTHQTTGQVYAYSTTTGDINSGYFLKDGEWQHITFVKSGTSHKFYINGKLFSDITDTEFSVSAGNYKIGQITSYFANGQYSNARLFNTALTAEQVADLYNNPEKVVPTGVDNTALKLWLPMMEGAGTTAYDGSGNGNHGTISGATYVNGIGAPVAQSAVIDWNKGTNETAYSEEFNSWTTKNDITIVDNDATAPDGQETAATITFAASQANARVQDFKAGSFGLENQIVSVWARATSGTAPFRFKCSHGGVTDYFSNDLTATTEWQRFSFSQTFGSSAGTGVFYGLYNGTDLAARSLEFWGFQLQTDAAALTPYVRTGATAQTSDVLLPQGLTTGRDITGVNLFENVRKQGALNLDGNSWAEVHDNASLDMTDAITLEAWYYNDGVNATKIIQGRWSNQVDMSYLMYLNNSNLIFVGHSGSGTFGGNASTTSLASNQYSHVAITYDKSYLKYYINGSLVDTFTFTVSLNPNATVALDIGRNDGRSGVYTGSNYNNTPIAQPRIYNRALTAEEVQRSYDSGKNIFTNS